MLTMKNIIKEGHETLYLKAKDVTLPLKEDDKTIIKEMHEFLVNSQDPIAAEKFDLRPGVGLAAPQINISKKMLCILTLDENFEKNYSLNIINPKIVSHSQELTYLDTGEGCLSIDRETSGLVPRFKRITVKGYHYDIEKDELREIKLRLKGYLSIVFQHEYDHLQGILFPTRIAKAPFEGNPVKFKFMENTEEE